MTDKLPPNLLKLFTPRPPLPFLPPLDRDPGLRRGPQISSIADFLPFIKDHDKDYTPTETLEQKRIKRKEEKQRICDEKIKESLQKWDPSSDPNATADPYKTLFVGRLSYETNKRTLKRIFDVYGPITKVHIVQDKEEKLRGYAFIEFERERDMKAAYKDADGMKVEGRRIVVDVERGRTVKGWRPRRLGGGLGGTRKGAPAMNQQYSGRERERPESPPPPTYRGSERGGSYRGDKRTSYDRRGEKRRYSRSPPPRYSERSDYGSHHSRDRRSYRDRR